MSGPVRGLIIFDNQLTVVRLIKASLTHVCSDRLVVTFDPMFITDTEKPAFAEQFLLSLGCDVIAVQKRKDAWYQDVDLIEFSRLISAIGSFYQGVFFYGSSMGAYLALYLSRVCRSRVLAISPCCYIHPGYPGHLARAKGRVAVFRHGAFVPAPEATGLVIYDPEDPSDREYVGNEVRPNYKNMDYLPIHFSGHSSVEFLHEIGVLKHVVVEFLAGKTPQVALSGRKGQSKKYLYTFARRCASRGRLQPAIAMMQRAVELSPNTKDFQHLLETLRTRAATGA